MRKTLHLSLLALSFLVLLSACHSLPDDARYIPKDAAAVVGINTNSIQKKLAWSAIIGSKLLDEMKENAKGKEALNGIEEAGINWSSTLYVYAKADKRFMGETKVAAIIPVSDAKKLEAYVKKAFPKAVIKQANKRSEALIEENVYASWNDETLMVMNTITKQEQHTAPAIDSSMTGATPEPMDDYSTRVTDETATAAEMDASFNISKEASLNENPRFTALQKEGHDCSIWAGYDAIMDSYGAKQGMNPMGLNMGASLWKNAAMTGGFDFEKGLIEGNMHYFPGDSMRDVATELGKENIDKDILGRLSNDNLDMVTAYHLSPSGLKMMLDKIGLTGMANAFLAQKGLTTDDILGAFTGDLVFAINNFSVVTKPADTALMQSYGLEPHPSTAPKMDMVYAMKIKNKAQFDKLIKFAAEMTSMAPSSPNTYSIPLPTGDTMSIITGDQYLAVSNRSVSAQAFLQPKSGKVPDVADREVVGHPAGLYIDVQQFLSKINPSTTGSASDSAAFIAVRDLFSNVSLNGGEFKGDASAYHLAINFMNKDENSLLQLLHFAQSMSKAKNAGSVVSK